MGRAPINFEDAVELARQAMRLLDLDAGSAVESQPLIPETLRDRVRNALEAEGRDTGSIRIADLRMVLDVDQHTEWLSAVDRREWLYWPRLRQLLLKRGRSPAVVRALDDATDRILGALEDPRSGRPFDRRGLVVGHVQSGKTANYSALMAKAADCGYRLFIVLTGIHDQLRQQTQRRLNSELVGGESDGVALPADDRRRWITFTTTDLHGDFQPGTVDTAALASGQPALIVAKKNAHVLTRLRDWLRTLGELTREAIPVLVIDDEADQASPNTRGNRAFPNEDDGDDGDVPGGGDEAAPSRINELIRALLGTFGRVAYVGYTATPFANVLIDHEADDHLVGADIYPRSFIVDLPLPPDYYGPDRIFGAGDDAESRGMDVIRIVSGGDLRLLVPSGRDEAQSFEPSLPESLREAIDAFVLASAARYERGHGRDPSSMLIHASHYTGVQQLLHQVVSKHMRDIRDEWRYAPHEGLENRLRSLWDGDFRRVTRASDLSLDVPFEDVAKHIGALLEHPVETVQLNSASEDILDYTRDPSLKVVVVGGNRLSRGLTLEGLLVSYYVRRANAYDTLMQMGRWFGYREGYADLTRLYTTADLAQWFRDLVSVEEEVRSDIRRYAEEGLTPLDFGVRIRRHPALLVTDRLKMRAARDERVSFAGQLVQTVVFPFSDKSWLLGNVEYTRNFLASLGEPTSCEEPHQPTWHGVSWNQVVSFLQSYRVDEAAARCNPQLLSLLVDFIRRQARQGELVRWVVGVMGLPKGSAELGHLDLGIRNLHEINLIERTRLLNTNSLGVITSPTHLELGLSDEQLEAARARSDLSWGRALRTVRDPREGLLLIYPISRYSGWHGGENRAPASREPIHPSPEAASEATDIVGMALALPESESAATVEYVVGTVGAREQG